MIFVNEPANETNIITDWRMPITKSTLYSSCFALLHNDFELLCS